MAETKTTPRKRRLFFALWPERGVAKQLHSLAKDLLTKNNDRIISVDLLHLTLRYVGSVEPSRQTCLEEMASKIRVAHFELSLDTPGYWKAPKVIWLAPKSWAESLKQLVSQLEQGCQQCGLEAEKRSFSPHVTLVRKAGRAPAGVKPEPIWWPVFDFALVESISTGQGVNYKVLKRWPLL